MHKDLPDWLFRPLTRTELYTLIILANSHNYAYNIAQSITQNLDASLHPSRQGITRALRRMAVTGWIAPYPHMHQTGRHERAYALTDFGEAQLSAELNRLNFILDQGQVSLARRKITTPYT
jgi:DNA-binding PadR family transcriptional regulator